MKTYLIALVILVLCFPSLAQNFSFSYDDAGNRIERTLILSTKSMDHDPVVSGEANQEEVKSEEEIINDPSGDISLNLYPNPTKGDVIVSIKTDKMLNNVSYRIVDLSGREVIKGPGNSDRFNIDMNDQSAGIYYLLISIDENERSWKLIKE